MSNKTGFSLWLLLAAVTVLAAGAHGAPIVVVSDQPFGAHPIVSDIQAALDVVDDDGFVWITPGTWPAPTTLITKAVTIQGRESEEEVTLHPEQVIIDGQNSRPGLEISNARVVLEGLTIIHGTYGIQLRNDTTAAIDRCYIRNNSGHGVHCQDTSTVLLTNCSITENGQYAVNIDSGSAYWSEVISCSLINNVGGALSLSGDCKAQVHNTLFYLNRGYPAPVTYIQIIEPVEVLAGYLYIYLEGASAASFVGPFQNNPGSDIFMPTPPTADDDPLLDPSASWWGKIDTTSGQISPLLDIGGIMPEKDTWFPERAALLDKDFEGGVRPVAAIEPTASYDIGADEVDSFLGDVQWVDCVIYSPNTIVPVRTAPYPVGPLPAGELTVSVRLQGYAGQFALYDAGAPLAVAWGYGDQAYIISQGALEAAADPLDYMIPLVPVTGDPGVGEWHNLTNAIAITNRHPFSEDVDPVVNDGVGYVQLVISGSVEEPADNAATNGRQVLIDTVSPWLLLGEAGMEGATAYEFLLFSNDGYSASDVIGDSWHPFYPAFIGAEPAVPFSNELFEHYPNGMGGTLFFNVGSFSNGPAAAETALALGIRAIFEDPPPWQTPDRPVSGFNQALTDYTDAEPYAGSAQDVASPKPLGDPLVGAPYWSFAEGYGTMIAPSDPVLAYFLVGPEPVNDLIAAYWIFPEGFPVERAGNGAWHVKASFAVQDLAGNFISADVLMDPLELWWLVEANTQLRPYYNREVKRPSFNWRFVRPVEPGPSAPAVPRFAFRLMATGDDVTYAKGPPYMPVTGIQGLNSNGWSSWITQTVLPYEWFQQSGVMEDYANQWLLLVLVGVDEAGNVETWPPELVLDAAGNVADIRATAGPNWQLFFIPGPGKRIDTTVSAFFWEDIENPPDVVQFDEGVERSLGSAEALCAPESGVLRAVFHIGAVLPEEVDPAVAFEQARVMWQLEEVGAQPPVIMSDISQEEPEWVVVDGRVQDWIEVLIPPKDYLDQALLRHGDEPDNEPVTYVFRAWLDLGPDPDDAEDTTPATYRFTVFDCTQENQTVDSDQPIKVFERQ